MNVGENKLGTIHSQDLSFCEALKYAYLGDLIWRAYKGRECSIQIDRFKTDFLKDDPKFWEAKILVEESEPDIYDTIENDWIAEYTDASV